MGEIKSTLEIIMEKTKGLTMSDQEKEAFQRKEAEGKLRGLLQRLLDGGLDPERLEKELAGFGENKGEVAREFLLRECLNRLDPQEDNAPLLGVMRRVAHVDTQPLERIISEFQQDLERQTAIEEQVLRERLAKRSITGTAVIPNPKADPEWLRHLSQMKKQFQEKLASVKGERIE